jgi:cytochrome c oxidase subunit 2
MYMLVMVGLGWAMVRARRRAQHIEAPAAGVTAAEPTLEKGLVGWAGLIILGLIALSVVSFLADRSLAIIGPKPLVVRVTGAQWWWKAEYSDNTPALRLTTANEIHLPLGRPARIVLQADDVIHSFWVPNLAGKEDLIPGRLNVMTITPRRAGVFRGQCAEFCGLEHALMGLTVTVEEPAAFEAWRQRQLAAAAAPTTPQQIEGQQIFQAKACVSCHRIGGTDAGGMLGPDLTHIASRSTLAAGTLPNTPEAMRRWIADPQAHKPGSNMPKVPLSGHEVSRLAEYMESLR